MGIVLKVLKVNGKATIEKENYMGGKSSVSYLYPDGTPREVKKFYLFPFGVKTVTQVSRIRYALDGVADIIFYNEWVDLNIH